MAAREIRALIRQPPQERVKGKERIETLILQMPMITRRGRQVPENLKKVAKDDCLHVASINTTHGNTAPTAGQARNIDHVKDLVSPKFRS